MKHILRVMVLALSLVLMVPFVMAQDELTGTPTEICEAAVPAAEPESREFTEAEDVLEIGVDYRAIMCTDAGAIYIDLLEDFAPATVNNFVFLAESGYYNNTIFHRVIEDFMAQGGDPTGTGSGGPGYQFRDEFAPFVSFDRPYLLAMANAGAGTNGSQFFITTAPTPHLDFRHTIFGDVLEGKENVANILLRDPAQADAPSTALQTVIIITDPSTVESADTAVIEGVTADEMIEALGVIGAAEQLPEDLAAGYEAPVVVDEAEMPALFTENGHVYRVTTAVANTQCAENYFFNRMDYTVDLFDSAATVESLLTSPEFVEWNAEAGFTTEASALNIDIYQQDAADGEGCSDDAVTMRAYLQRGAYLVTIDLLVAQSMMDEAGQEVLVNLLVTQIPQIFETGITNAYRVSAPSQ
jgi:cyclophilin family peptidyl-prolyl cis-trans isomerase